MYFFVNNIMQKGKSGIEHAQIKRLQLFNDHQVPAKIVTREYDRELHRNMALGDIAEGDLINLFDWLQGTVTYEGQKTRPEQIRLPKGATLSVDGTDYVAMMGDRKVAKITTFAPDYTTVNDVTYFDQFDNPLRRDLYDLRGFLSMETLFDFDGNPLTERMYTPAGKLVFESSYLTDKHGVRYNSLLRVTDYQGQSYSFPGLRSLFRWFLDRLNEANGLHNTFIQDRYENDWSIVNMKTPAYKFLHIHNVHVNNADDMMHASLNFNYEFGLFNLSDWDGVIVATHRQHDDTVRRFGEKVPVYVLPVGVVPTELLNAPRVPMAQRTPHQVVMMARQAPEKQIDHAIQAVKATHVRVGDIKLDVYGYGTKEMTDKLNGVIKEAGATDYIHLHDYTPDVEAVYNNAQALLLTSTAEGFALVLLEAISHGVPALSYDIAYGPADIIESGKNGGLFKPGAYLDISQSLVNIFTDDKQLQKLSDGAYDSAVRFSEENLWLKWRAVINATPQH